MLEVTQVERENDVTLIELTAEIVSAYVTKNAIQAADLPALIHDFHDALVKTNAPTALEAEPEKPAVPIKKSVKKDQIICLECGKGFKSLKRHLNTHHDLEPADYRAKWGFDTSYPMVAPEYAEQRSSLAKEMGLGQQRKNSRAKSTGRSRKAS